MAVRRRSREVGIRSSKVANTPLYRRQLYERLVQAARRTLGCIRASTEATRACTAYPSAFGPKGDARARQRPEARAPLLTARRSWQPPHTRKSEKNGTPPRRSRRHRGPALGGPVTFSVVVPPT